MGEVHGALGGFFTLTEERLTMNRRTVRTLTDSVEEKEARDEDYGVGEEQLAWVRQETLRKLTQSLDDEDVRDGDFGLASEQLTKLFGANEEPIGAGSSRLHDIIRKNSAL